MKQPRIITMQTNFDGLIRLLADGLYSTSDIFVRELVQNGHDSIVRRQALQEHSYQGEISVTYDTIERSITFTDNGIGMDLSDIENFLSVIGSTGTGQSRNELEAAFSEELIGQFGIGLLSSFLVAQKVRVQTRKLGNDHAFEWVNTGSTQCELSYIDRHEVGSSVTVYLRPNFTYLLNSKKLTEILIRYCDFIAVPIRVNNVGPINAIYAPWDRTYTTVEQELDAYSSFVNRRFPDMSMDVFPVNIAEKIDGVCYRAQGVLYISDQRLPGLNSTGTLDIFVRKMLVKEGDTTLLPSWAKFVRGVLDSPDLSPTAGRDNINQENKAFRVIQEGLGKRIIERLAYLAQNRPDKFSYINQWHHDHLKGMAMVNEEFFTQVSELLLFETNRGDLSLKQYLPENPLLDNNRAPVYYFSHYDSAAQYYRMAEEKGLVVINAGKDYDEELLEKYGERHPEVILEKLNVLDTGIFFEELSEEIRTNFRPLEAEMSYHLNNELRLNVVLSTKEYAPREVPAVIIETEVSKTDRELRNLLNAPSLRMNFGDAFRSVQESIRNRPIQLALNAANPLIQMLTKQNLRATNILAMFTLIYNNALLYSHRLDEKNMSIVHDGIVNMMAQLLVEIDKNKNLQTQLQEQRNELMKSAKGEHPEHIQLFMITPFADDYKPVENAVRQVFEQAPFCFEIRLARDYYAAETLVENVKTQIASAHGFVAEISEQNANVMMEVGGILMSGDTRPVFALEDSHSGKKRPADFGDKLTFPYGGKTAPIDDNIAQLSGHLFEGGRIKNARLKELLRQRKKLYLSDILLEKNSRLNQKERDKVRKTFSAVEDFLAAEDSVLNGLNVDLLILKSAQQSMRSLVEECKGYEK